MKLYSYQNSVEYKFESLKNFELFFTYPECFNDIFEFKSPFLMTPAIRSDDLGTAIDAAVNCQRDPHVLYSAELKSTIEFLAELAKDFDDPLDQSLVNNFCATHLQKMLVENVGVMCFTTSCINQLMWSYYADSYRGFCVAFELDFDALYSNDFFIEKINYVDHRPTVDMWQMLFTDFSKKTVFTKSNAWAHENEYRLAVSKNTLKNKGCSVDEKNINGFKVSIPHGIKVTELIIGKKMDQSNRAILRRIAEILSEKQDCEVKIGYVEPRGDVYELHIQWPLISKTL